MATIKKLTPVQQRNAALVAGIESYTGKKVTDINVILDPKVSRTFAMRVTIEGHSYPLDMLIVGGNMETGIAEATPEVIAENLEECEFETWPPKSGSLKFF